MLSSSRYGFISLGLGLYTVATVHVATWLWICTLPREDFAASSAKRLYSICYHLPLMVLRLILMGKILVSVKSITKHPLIAVIFQVLHCSQICTSLMRKAIQWSLKREIAGWSRHTLISHLLPKKWLGRIILI